MVRWLLASAVALLVVSSLAAACAPARTPVRSALGALREHRQERIQSRGAGCAGSVSYGCRGATSYGCAGYTPAQTPMPLVVPMPDPKKK